MLLIVSSKGSDMQELSLSIFSGIWIDFSEDIGISLFISDELRLISLLPILPRKASGIIHSCICQSILFESIWNIFTKMRLSYQVLHSLYAGLWSYIFIQHI